MFRPVAMGKLRVLILQRHLDAVTNALGEFGGVHLVDAVETGLSELDAHAEIARFDALLAQCDTLIQRLGVKPDTRPEPPPSERLDELAARFAVIEADMAKAEKELEDLVRESGLLVQRAERLRRLPTEDVPLMALRSLGHLHLLYGRVPAPQIAAMQAVVGERGLVLHDASVPERRNEVLIVTTRRGRWAVEADIQEFGFAGEELPGDVDGSAGEARTVAENLLDQTRQRIVACCAAGERLAASHGPFLKAVRNQLARSLALAGAKMHFGKSERLVSIAGWVPMHQVETVQRVVEETTGGTGIVEVRPADADPAHGEVDSVPVQMAPNPLLRPFQTLVANFGSPRYGEVDPSLFVGLTFVVMFGIMFGDVGQGLALGLLGLWLWRSRRPGLIPLRDGGMLLMLCGLSSMVFGFLYGSIFGYEGLLPPLWLSPMHDVSKLLGTAVVLGIVFISVAILINIVNKVRSRRYFESVFDKFGVLGIIFYWGALGLGLQMARKGELSAAQIMLVIVVPLALLFIREPLHNLLHRRRLLADDPFSFVLEASIEILETFTAFLGGTVSFVRVGAFALSHAALCLAIYSVADIMKSLPGGGIWVVLVLALGNLLVIVMEGMVAMIQGVRLQYYELFSKYFAGDGVAYRPFELRQVETSPTSKPGEPES